MSTNDTLTVSIPAAARLVGIGVNKAYAKVTRGEWPVVETGEKGSARKISRTWLEATYNLVPAEAPGAEEEEGR